jgi:beta-lactamase superfamily II metal-dependent hydrolase
MKTLFNIFNIFCALLLLMAKPLIADDLNIRIFKVGQANAVLLTKDNTALVVDCGNGSRYGQSFDNGLCGQSIKRDNVLSQCDQLKIIITHDHDDHYNAINAFKGVVDKIKNIINIISIWNEALYDSFSGYKKVGVFKHGNWQYAGWLNGADNINGYLSGALGDDVTVTCLRPDKFEDTLLNPEKEHDNNVLLYIEYRGIGILLPGDANSTLLAYHMLHTPNFINTLKNVNILLIPHHGSAKSGEQLWIDAIFGGVGNNKIKMLFISSDPEEENKIPKEWLCKQLDSKKLPNFEYIGRTWRLQHCCYRISIDANGQIEVFDGKNQLFPAQ